MIIWLSSYPRSGNTWARILLNRLYGISTYSIYNDPLFKKNGIADIVGQNEVNLEKFHKDDEYKFVKTHTMVNECKYPDCPTIYIIRDGRDAAVSYAHFNQQHDSKRSLEKEFMNVMTGAQHPGKWGKHVDEWTKMDNVVIVKYENLIKQPINEITKAIDRLGLDLKAVDTNLPTFEELHQKWPTFFRSGKVGEKAHGISNNLIAMFTRLNMAQLKRFGYIS